MEGVDVVQRATCLAFTAGPASAGARWDVALAKIHSRLVRIRSLATHMHDKIWV